MIREKVLVLGLGEVGRPLFEILKESEKFVVYGFDTNKEKMHAVGQAELPGEVDVMHVCIPCSNREEFVNAVMVNVKQFGPKLVIINSTVLPGTTIDVYKRCSCLTAHSPVRGVHKNLEYMKLELKHWTKYVGGASAEAGKAAQAHFKEVGLKTRILKSCTETELAKLFETTYRAWMIACFQEMHRISRHFKADFDEVADFIEDTHRVRLDRPLMFPGPIGGHCLIANVKLLLSRYDSEFLRLILESNEKREVELENKDVQREVEKARKRAETLQKKLMQQNQIPGVC